MKRFRVEVSEPVLQQIFEQVLFISEDSMSNALAWETRLLTALDRLSDIHGHAVDEDASEQLGRRTQKMVFEETYLVHYHVNEAAGVVHVINFRHGARLPQEDEP